MEQQELLFFCPTGCSRRDRPRLGRENIANEASRTAACTRVSFDNFKLLASVNDTLKVGFFFFSSTFHREKSIEKDSVACGITRHASVKNKFICNAHTEKSKNSFAVGWWPSELWLGIFRALIKLAARETPLADTRFQLRHEWPLTNQSRCNYAPSYLGPPAARKREILNDCFPRNAIIRRRAFSV